jgi:hypothetical protein
MTRATFEYNFCCVQTNVCMYVHMYVFSPVMYINPNHTNFFDTILINALKLNYINFITFYKRSPRSKSSTGWKSDQWGEFLPTYWAIVYLGMYFWQFLRKFQTYPKCCTTFSTEKSYVLILTKMGWATFRAIIWQTQLVTLIVRTLMASKNSEENTQGKMCAAVTSLMLLCTW